MQKEPLNFLSSADKDKILKEILNLDASEACQNSDIPPRIIEENPDIFTGLLNSSFNNSIYQSEFPSILKLARITPVLKKGGRQSPYYQTSQKFLNNACFVKFPGL